MVKFKLKNLLKRSELGLFQFSVIKLFSISQTLFKLNSFSLNCKNNPKYLSVVLNYDISFATSYSYTVLYTSANLYFNF